VKENPVQIGPAGTGKSHALVGLGHAAVASGWLPGSLLHRGRGGGRAVPGTRRQLGGRVIETDLKADAVLQ